MKKSFEIKFNEFVELAQATGIRHEVQVGQFATYLGITRNHKWYWFVRMGEYCYADHTYDQNRGTTSRTRRSRDIGYNLLEKLFNQNAS